MKRFEYEIVCVTASASIKAEDTELQKLGRQGWELAAVATGPGAKFLYFKRSIMKAKKR